MPPRWHGSVSPACSDCSSSRSPGGRCCPRAAREVAEGGQRHRGVPHVPAVPEQCVRAHRDDADLVGRLRRASASHTRIIETLRGCCSARVGSSRWLAVPAVRWRPRCVDAPGQPAVPPAYELARTGAVWRHAGCAMRAGRAPAPRLGGRPAAVRSDAETPHAGRRTARGSACVDDQPVSENSYTCGAGDDAAAMPDLVQLLTPEGERRPSRVLRLPRRHRPEELRGFYRDLPDPARRHGGHRCSARASSASGRRARPGGSADRVGRALSAQDYAFPTCPWRGSVAWCLPSTAVPARAVPGRRQPAAQDPNEFNFHLTIVIGAQTLRHRLRDGV